MSGHSQQNDQFPRKLEITDITAVLSSPNPTPRALEDLLNRTSGSCKRPLSSPESSHEPPRKHLMSELKSLPPLQQTLLVPTTSTSPRPTIPKRGISPEIALPEELGDPSADTATSEDHIELEGSVDFSDNWDLPPGSSPEAAPSLVEVAPGTSDEDNLLQPNTKFYTVNESTLAYLTGETDTAPIDWDAQIRRWSQDDWVHLVMDSSCLLPQHFLHCLPSTLNNEEWVKKFRRASNNLAISRIRASLSTLEPADYKCIKIGKLPFPDAVKSEENQQMLSAQQEAVEAINRTGLILTESMTLLSRTVSNLRTLSGDLVRDTASSMYATTQSSIAQIRSLIPGASLKSGLPSNVGLIAPPPTPSTSAPTTATATQVSTPSGSLAIKDRLVHNMKKPKSGLPK